MTEIVDPSTWPDATIVVRGGVNTLDELEAALPLGGAQPLRLDGRSARHRPFDGGAQSSAQAGSMARSRQVITIRADFNHLDGRGRLILSDLRIHEHTPFVALAAAGKPILFVQGEDIVFGSLVEDPDRGWCGVPDWDTQDVLQEYPEPVLANRAS